MPAYERMKYLRHMLSFVKNLSAEVDSSVDRFLSHFYKFLKYFLQMQIFQFMPWYGRVL